MAGPKPKPSKKAVFFFMDPKEHAAVKAASKIARKTFSSFCRDVLFEASKAKGKP